jgi:hypothetical protein
VATYTLSANGPAEMVTVLAPRGPGRPERSVQGTCDGASSRLDFLSSDWRDTALICSSGEAPKGPLASDAEWLWIRRPADAGSVTDLVCLGVHALAIDQLLELETDRPISWLTGFRRERTLELWLEAGASFRVRLGPEVDGLLVNGSIVAVERRASWVDVGG